MKCKKEERNKILKKMKKKFKNTCSYKYLPYICTHKNERSSLKQTNKNCGCGVIGSHARLRIWCREAWGFESLHPHSLRK